MPRWTVQIQLLRCLRCSEYTAWNRYELHRETDEEENKGGSASYITLRNRIMFGKILTKAKQYLFEEN